LGNERKLGFVGIVKRIEPDFDQARPVALLLAFDHAPLDQR